MANPAGYIAADSPIERLTLALPTRTFLGFGPAWLDRGEVIFLIVVALTSVAIKLGFRIP